MHLKSRLKTNNPELKLRLNVFSGSPFSRRNTYSHAKSLWKKYFILMSRKLHPPKWKTEARQVRQQICRKSIFDRGISLDCRRPSRVYACLSNVCKYCNKELGLLNSTSSVFSVCRACVLVVFLAANVRFQKLRFPFS